MSCQFHFERLLRTRLGVSRVSSSNAESYLGDSQRELKTFPAPVQDEMGYAIYLAQRGDKHVSARPLKGLGSGVLEVVSAPPHRKRTLI